MIRLVSVLIFLVGVATVRAADGPCYTLLGATLEQSSISSLRFIDQSIEFKSADGKPSRLNLSEILTIDLQDSPKGTAPADLWIATLSDGSRVGGLPVRLEGDRLRWLFQSGASSAELIFDLATIRSISRLGEPVEASSDPITEDFLRLRNGDIIRGIIQDITEQTISIQSDGKKFEASRDDVTLLRLAKVPTDSSEGDAQFVLRLNDPAQSVLRVTKIEGSEQGVVAMLGDQSLTLDPSLIASLRNTNGRAKFLIDFKPKSIEFFGYFASEGQAPQFNLPERSIRTRSYTQIVYDVSGFDAIQTRFAVPPGLDHANVTVRIRLDGKPAFERVNVTSGTTSELISLKLDGASELTLETDFGENFDVQDRLIWLEPVLAR